MKSQSKLLAIITFIPSLLLLVIAGLVNAFTFILNAVAFSVMKCPKLFGSLFAVFCLALTCAIIWLVGSAMWNAISWIFDLISNIARASA